MNILQLVDSNEIGPFTKLNFTPTRREKERDSQSEVARGRIEKNPGEKENLLKEKHATKNFLLFFAVLYFNFISS